MKLTHPSRQITQNPFDPSKHETRFRPLLVAPQGVHRLSQGDAYPVTEPTEGCVQFKCWEFQAKAVLPWKLLKDKPLRMAPSEGRDAKNRGKWVTAVGSNPEIHHTSSML